MKTSNSKLLSKKAKKRKMTEIEQSVEEKSPHVSDDEEEEDGASGNEVHLEGLKSAVDFPEEAESDQEEVEVSPKEKKVVDGTKKKKKKPGVLYLATVPKTLTVAQIRSFMSQFGKVGRIFLQPESKGLKRSKKKRFCEGWVEMEKKSVAKKIAQALNNTRIGYKKRSHLYDSLWSLKYLTGFKWAHLNERLEYERQIRKQRMMNEISQAKRETDAYAKAVAKARYLKNKGVLRKDDSEQEDEEEEEEAVLQEPSVPVVKNRDALLSNIFARKK